MRVIFKNKLGGLREKNIDFNLNLGTLEATCRVFDCDLWNMKAAMEKAQKEGRDFSVELLYQAYISACKDRYDKPNYTIEHAKVWKEYMSTGSQKELNRMMTELFGQIEKATVKKKQAAAKKK